MEQGRHFEMKAIKDIGFVRFFEDQFFMVSRRTVANHCVSIIFFGFCILSSFVTIVMRKDGGESAPLVNTDVIFYLTTFSPEFASRREVEVAMTIVLVIIVSYVMIVFLSMMVSTQSFPFLRRIFCFIWFYCFPATFVLLTTFNAHVNVIGIADFNARVAFSFVFHSLFAMMFGVNTLVNVLNPRVFSHPFFTVCSWEAILLSLYITMFSNLVGLGTRWMVILRMILSFAMFCVSVVRPLYFSMIVNSLFMAFVVQETVNCGLILKFWDDRDSRMKWALISLGGTIVVSVLYSFVIYPFLIAHEVVSLYMRRKLKKCRSKIETLNLKEFGWTMRKTIVSLSLDLAASNNRELIEEFRSLTRTIDNSIYVVLAERYYMELKDITPEHVTTEIEKFEARIEKLRMKFREALYVSNFNRLPSLCGKMTRIRYRAIRYSVFQAERYRTLELSPNAEMYRNSSRLARCKSQLRWMDGFLLIMFLLHIAGHALILSSSNERWNFVNEFLSYRRFVSHALRGLTSLWTGSTLVIADTEWVTVNQSLEVVLTSDILSLSPIVADVVTIFMDWQEEMKRVTPTGTFPVDFTEEMYTAFDLSLKNMIDSFSNFTGKRQNVYSEYSYAIMLFGPLAWIIGSVIYYFHTFHKVYDRFKKLVTYKKSDINKPDNIQMNRVLPYMRYRGSLEYNFVYLVLGLALLLFLTLFLGIGLISGKSDAELIGGVIESFSDVERVPLWFVAGITSLKLTEFNLSNDTVALDHLNYSDTLYDWFIRNPEMAEFTLLISQTYLRFIADTAILGADVHTFQEWKDVLDEMTVNFNTQAAQYNDLERYFITKFVAMFCLVFACYLLFAFILISLNPFAIAEERGAEAIMNEFIVNEEEEEYKRLKWKFHKRDLPLVCFAVDTKLKVLWASNYAVREYGLSKHKDISKSRMDVSKIEDLRSEIEKLRENVTTKYAAVPCGHVSTMTLIPYHSADKINDIQLSQVVIIERPENTHELSDMEASFDRLFHTFYPDFISVDDTLPLRIHPESKPYLFLYMKLNGLSKWIDETDLNTVVRFHNEMYAHLARECAESEYFARARQYGETLIFPMDHANVSRMSVWKVLEYGAAFGSKVIDMVQKLETEFQVHGTTFMLMFKCFEPDIYMSDDLMSISDFVGDIEYIGEEHAIECVTGQIQFASVKREMKIANTTKLKTCHTANGEPFEMFLMV